MSSRFHIAPFETWGKSVFVPFLIAGPCSAESEEQVMATALAVAKIPLVRVFRAGIWKPRTRPSSFEGVGSKGLTWLRRVKLETRLMAATEVANPKHVEEALRNDMDILWIGARTVVNPFSVQEIGEALKGVDIPVMIKNPLNPDLKTWIGALERINHAGINRLMAIHRGFSFYKHSPYRNDPMWEIPIELKRLYPELPLIADPSHICGKPEFLLPVSQRALDLEMSGLMIETHIHPEEALTDREQQISPDRLKRLLTRLIIRKPFGSVVFHNKLDKLRSEIDRIDQQLLDILARRMLIADDIGRYKKSNKITILQLRRWSQIFKERLASGQELGLSHAFILKLLEAIHEESIQRQIDVMNREK